MVCNKQGCKVYACDLLYLCKPGIFLLFAFTLRILSQGCVVLYLHLSQMMALCLTCSEGTDGLRVNDHIKGRHCRDKKISSNLTQRQKHQEETRLSGSGKRKVVSQQGYILKDNFSFRIRKTKTNVKQLYGPLSQLIALVSSSNHKNEIQFCQNSLISSW